MCGRAAGLLRLLAMALLLALVACDDESSQQTTSASTSGSGGGGGSQVDPPIAGPAEYPCEPGSLLLDDGSCLEAGVPPEECGSGLEPTADRSCEPILPAAPCADGEMALPGEARCRPVAPCGSGTWGDIPVEASTVYVDGSYAGGGSDGSAGKPFTTVATGIAAATGGAIVAVAAGTYAEVLVVEGKQVRLWGRCPAMVRIYADGSAPLSIESGADGSEVRDLAFEAPNSVAVHIGGSVDVVVDRVWVQNADLIGIDVEGNNPGARVTRSLIEDTASIGIFGYGAELEVEDTEIRGVMHNSQGSFGTGIRVFADGVPTELTVRRTLIAGAFGAGIFVHGSHALVEDSVVTDVEPQPKEQDDGRGIVVSSDEDGHQGALELARSYIARTHVAGVDVITSPAVVDGTVIRDVSAAPAASTSSYGIRLTGPQGMPAVLLQVRSSVIESTTVYGIAVLGSDAVVEATIVRDTEPHPGGLVPGGPDVGGRGVGAEGQPGYPRPMLTVSGSRIERTHESGIMLLAADALVEDTLVRDVSARSTDGLFGRGINIQVEVENAVASSAVVRRCLVEGAHEHAIMVMDSEATIEDTVVRDTKPSEPIRFEDGAVVYGRGIGVEGHLYLDAQGGATIERCLIESSQEAALFVAGADATVRSTILRTSAGGLGGLFGDGILVVAMPDDLFRPQQWYPSSLVLEDSILEGNARAGIASFGGAVDVAGSLFSCNAIDLNGEVFEGFDFEFTDSGGNVCRCGQELRPCKSVSSGLVAPSPSL